MLEQNHHHALSHPACRSSLQIILAAELFIYHWRGLAETNAESSYGMTGIQGDLQQSVARFKGDGMQDAAGHAHAFNAHAATQSLFGQVLDLSI